ncbi:MAG: 6-phosphofructokinase [Lachnospiraceae bacterium]|nr:6-phosphofructokinase [Lachnospiraceae bacterium]
MLRVGMLTSGGDCQALNPTMRAIARTLYTYYDNDVEIFGFIDGYFGLMYGEYRKMQRSDFSGLLTRGGTILGTSRQPFKLMEVPDERGLDKVQAMIQTYHKLRLDCLFVLGGNGSQKTAYLLSQKGLNVIGLPKTIDNDLWGTDMTFGFNSAVQIATQAIDCIHTTAASHNRVFIVEIMGHKVGSLTLEAGLAGGADVILIPEIPYDIKKVADAVLKRKIAGRGFTVIAVAEGAISKEDAKLSKKDYKKKQESSLYPSISYEIAAQLSEMCKVDCRVTVPGHTQRGGSPSPYDRALSSRFGAHAGYLCHKGIFGKLVVIKEGKVTDIPMEESAGKLKYVDPESDEVRAARLLGLSFGD